jgi:hypothetical protein
MGSPSYTHDNKRDGDGESCSKPLKGWILILAEIESKDDCDDDADQGAEQVTEDKGPGLGMGRVNGAETEYG